MLMLLVFAGALDAEREATPDKNEEDNAKIARKSCGGDNCNCCDGFFGN